MDRTEVLNLAAQARSGHLATVGSDGAPHLVVVTFALTKGTVVTAVDHKPKTTTRLQRLKNIEATGKASFLVDHYEDDWTRLWWVRIDGSARVVHDGPDHQSAVESLGEKYDQYASTPPVGPVIVLSMDRVSHWSSTR